MILVGTVFNDTTEQQLAMLLRTDISPYTHTNARTHTRTHIHTHTHTLETKETKKKPDNKNRMRAGR